MGCAAFEKMLEQKKYKLILVSGKLFLEDDAGVLHSLSKLSIRENTYTIDNPDLKIEQLLSLREQIEEVSGRSNDIPTDIRAHLDEFRKYKALMNEKRNQ
jgi:hypothetical protein